MFSKDIIQTYLDKNLIRVQKHPDHGLFIYNYTAAAQYERYWDEVTLNCRGLILDEDMNIVARPFPKFFNLGENEHQIIPNEPFDVYDKMDGSLGILYWINDQPFIATSGSYTSEQSVIATKMLYNKYKLSITQLDKNSTYLFEIIYPENRIVVNYDGMNALILLGVIDTKTGEDRPLQDIGFPLVKKYDGIKDIHQLKAINIDNKEGFVIRFQSGLRYKIKMEEYVRLHRLVTQISTVSIWAHLSQNAHSNTFDYQLTLTELLERVPDEFYDWVKEQETILRQAYLTIEQECQKDFKILNTRKETAKYFLSRPYPSVLFNMLDNKDYQAAIWKQLKPDFKKPF